MSVYTTTSSNSNSNSNSNSTPPSSPPPASHPQTPASSFESQEFTAISELFSNALSVLDPNSLKEVMTMTVRAPTFMLANYNHSHNHSNNHDSTILTTLPPLLFDACLIHPPSLILIQTLLANPSASMQFGRVILMDLCKVLTDEKGANVGGGWSGPMRWP